MTTFATLATRNGVGGCAFFEVSLDAGATYTKIYSTATFVAGGGLQLVEPRIKSIGTLSRQLGADRGFTASAVSVVLENTDGGVDWVADQITYGTQGMRSLWRFKVRLFDAQDPTDYNDKVLGIFSLMDPGQRSNSTVELQLVDGGLGMVSQMAATPSVRDWCAITDANRPSRLTTAALDDPSQEGAVSNYDYDAPTPLVWGNNEFPIRRTFRNCYVICAVPGTKGALPEVIDYVKMNNGVPLPSIINSVTAIGSAIVPVWTVHRTPDIVKDGKTWHLLWMDLDLSGDSTPGSSDAFVYINRYLSSMYDISPTTKNIFAMHDVIGPVTVGGSLFSHNNASDLQFRGVPAVTIANDLVTTCLPAALTVVGYAEALAARPTAFAGGSVIQGVQVSTAIGGAKFLELTNGDMARALRQLCAVGQFDMFFTWSGSIKFAAMAADYASQTDAVATIYEGDFTVVGDKIPGVGERNAPANRTFVNVAGTRYGPIDDPVKYTAWGKKWVPREVDGTWLPQRQVLVNNGTTGVYRGVPNLDQYRINDVGTIRPTITIEAGVNGLNHELADYVYLRWVRGTLGTPYTNTLFRVEGIAVDFLEGKVRLTLSWSDDLRAAGSLPYILDDETLNVRIAATGGRTMTLTTGSTTVVCSTPNLGTDGVLAGDVIEVDDPAESAVTFLRNRMMRILGVTATTLTVDVSDFGAGGPFVISSWTIYKGPLTSGRAAYYGKTCGVLGTFYNGDPANRLLEG